MENTSKIKRRRDGGYIQYRDNTASTHSRMYWEHMDALTVSPHITAVGEKVKKPLYAHALLGARSCADAERLRRISFLEKLSCPWRRGAGTKIFAMEGHKHNRIKWQAMDT